MTGEVVLGPEQQSYALISLKDSGRVELSISDPMLHDQTK